MQDLPNGGVAPRAPKAPAVEAYVALVAGGVLIMGIGLRALETLGTPLVYYPDQVKESLEWVDCVLHINLIKPLRFLSVCVKQDVGRARSSFEVWCRLVLQLGGTLEERGVLGRDWPACQLVIVQIVSMIRENRPPRLTVTSILRT